VAIILIIYLDTPIYYLAVSQSIKCLLMHRGKGGGTSAHLGSATGNALWPYSRTCGHIGDIATVITNNLSP